MLHLDKILNGWENYISKNEVTEKLAKERAEKCSICPNAKSGKLLIFVKDDLKEIEGHYCDLCKCPLSAKVRSINEKCDDNKW